MIETRTAPATEAANNRAEERVIAHVTHGKEIFLGWYEILDAREVRGSICDAKVGTM